MSTIKFVIVGCGHIGQRHAQMVLRNSACELLALVEINENVHQELKIKFKVPIYTYISDFVQSAIKTDVMVIAAPNGTHAELTLQALKADCHVVVEKPMAIYAADCKAMIEASEKYKKNIFCVMQNRFSPPAVWLKSVVDSSVLGTIYMVQINCFWNRDERYYKNSHWKGTKELDGGTLYTQFSHFVDMMYWLFGDISEIVSQFKDINHQGITAFEDTGMIQFDFVKGGLGSFNYTTSVYNQNLESSITIIAEKGTIKVGGQYMDEVISCDIKDYQMPTLEATNPANDYGHYKGSAANHHFIIENVVDVLNHGNEIHTPALEGMKVVEMIERMYSSAKV